MEVEMAKSKTMMRTLFLLVLAALSAVVPAALAGNENPGVLPTGSHPHGHSYGEWGAAWWQWALGIPAADNPLLDGDPLAEQANCPVVFLAGNFGGTSTRSVTVKPGTTLYVPYLNFLVWSPNDLAYGEAIATYLGLDPGQLSDEELLRLAANFWLDDAAATITLEVDGVSVQNPTQYRADTPAFTIVDDDLLEDFGIPVEPDNIAVAAGYAVMLTPLTPGDHLIHFASAIDPPDVPGFEQPPFELEVTYAVTVAPGAPSPCDN